VLGYTGNTYEDFCRLFADSLTIDGIYKKRLPNNADNIPTDEQAEVLIHESIHYYDIKEIVVKDERTKNKCERILEENKINWISLTIDESLFCTKKNSNEQAFQIDVRKSDDTIDETLAHNSDVVLPF